jgi:thiamine biosynthesis protein ThiS
MPAASAIAVRVNGEAHEIAPGASVADLLSQLGLDRGRVAVERNRSVVPRSEHTETRLEEGDVLELVTFGGGG